MRAAIHAALAATAIPIAFAVVALTPAADPASLLPGIAEVSAAADPSAFAAPARATPALSSIKAVARIGTPAASGPSANIGQSISLKGEGVAEGVARFAGYNGVDVTTPLTSVKPGKKAKAVVPNLAVTGDVTIVPSGGEESTPLRLQIVPTLTALSQPTVNAGDSLSIAGTGFAPDLSVVFPGVPAPVAPAQFDNDSATAVVPAGVQKGKIKVMTAGGMSNTLKLKITAGPANKLLATDPATGLILVTDDMENTLSLVDPATGSTLRTVTLRSEPTRIFVAADERQAFVVYDAGDLAAIDLDSWEVTDGVRGRPADGVGRTGGITLDDRGLVVDDVSVRWVGGKLERVAARRHVPLGPGVEAKAVSADGDRVVVLAGDHGRLYVVDLTSMTLVHTIDVGGPIEGVTIGVDGRVYTMDRATGQLLAFPVD